ncbi:GGDEF domain-containing protein [Gallaecimonas mangrovi]|uniref:GGDEF domain-containing protein n=1 Tax=Gallaecimonas mangrovi TaxID=2291597 RepID=UPI000E1FE920|nr:sensor domain-containing diguanylate cyclase [Gallaecimonas mangrovi]
MMSLSLVELQQLLDVLQTMDVGLVILDRQYKVHFWNDFMANHANKSAEEVAGKSLFDVFSNLPQDWLKQKTETVIALETLAFSTWEQRPHLFPFYSYRALTGRSSAMYQNLTFMPISSGGKVDKMAIIVYDVTEAANNRLALEDTNQRLSVLSRTDPLTGLLNRRSWELALAEEFARCRRSNYTSTLMMFDIDHFKQVNDTYGHPVGDKVLQHTAELLNGSLRTTDKAGRYGGEEFALLLVDTDAAQASQLADRLTNALAEQPAVIGDKAIRITISAGIAELTDDMQDAQQWIKAADDALYRAKSAGRNTICLA